MNDCTENSETALQQQLLLSENIQQKREKPIPKPRKSLPNNFHNKSTFITTKYDLDKSNLTPIHNQPIQNSRYQQKQHLITPTRPLSPPPLPPRPSLCGMERPLPLPQLIDHGGALFHTSAIDKSIIGEKKTQRIYPILDDLFYTNTHEMDNEKSNLALAQTMSCSSTTASDSHSSENSTSFIASSLGAEIAPSPSNPFSSYCEPFDGYLKFDGESICFSGWVQLPQGMFKHRKRGWAVVRNNTFSISQDDESRTPFFGPVELSKCVFLGKESDSESVVVFILRDLSKRSKSQKHLMNSSDELNTVRFTPEENHGFWLSLMAKCCSPRNDLFREKLPMVECCGRLWVKQGISGHWNEGWAFVHGHSLTYWVQAPNAIAEVDIRKIFLVKQNDIPSSDWCNYIDHSSSGPLLIALEGSSLYLQSEFDQCTSNWLNFLQAQLRRVSNSLEECRLTPDNVPIIVDKCIGLVATYGMLQPGIYRKNGSSAEVKRIIQQLKEDPHSVHFKAPITDEMINAIADVLRTFFRQLNAPLIPFNIQSDLYEISQFLPAEKKSTAYRERIESLPKVHQSTLKKLLGHLQEIVSHEDRNLASLENISKVFGPTLFNVSNAEEEISLELYNTATKQAIVTRDLIFYYCDIFGVDAEQLLAKCRMDVVREQKTSKNPANGLLIPVHLFERDNKCFNVQSEWTAAQVVQFKVQKLAFVSPCENYALFEMIKKGQLERRIGANESLRSIVLGRWMTDGVEEQQKDNFLLLKKDPHPFQPQSGRAFAEDLKLAEPGSRTFKTASLRIEDGVHVCHYSRGMKRQCQWKVDEVLWFVGAESDRRCPYPHPLTFFVYGREKRATFCKGKFPGFCVAFKDEIQRLQWLNQVIVSAQEYLPMPIIQI
ncbi:hypothetical protein niasHT_005277 [Heterodera trifolii]|uniref:Rho-GAP domain-containing protein n=1 Tax=Heterodera trifolii TaxID=157864 RepID=A0ABD2KJC6_9BILA